MKAKMVLFLSVILFLFSCKEESNDELIFDFGQETEFQIFREYLSGAHDLRFTIADVNDSRCPDGAMCIWAGEVEVKIAIEKPVVDTVSLKLPGETIGNSGIYNFGLVEVSPYPVVGKEIRTKDYMVLLKITKQD
uniref:hypothetical protein n=1 Tax=uncultured Draconibacterium sp. TaxID=1573823 RepID=UPI00321784CC